jgi:protein gp37
MTCDGIAAIMRRARALSVPEQCRLQGATVGGSGRSEGHPIVGGESGPRLRRMAEQWVAEIEAACRKAWTAFFFKQWGGVRKKSTGRHYRGRTFDEMPRAVAVS